MTKISYHISHCSIRPCPAQVMARHPTSMGEGIFQGNVGGSPVVLQNEIFANEGGKRGLPCERIAGIGGIIDKE